MAYSYNSPNFFNTELEGDWHNADTSQFLWDSPQPESQVLPSAADGSRQNQFSVKDSSSTPENTAHNDYITQTSEKRNPVNAPFLPHRSTPQGNFAVRSSTSENSSQSSSSGSSAKKRKASSTSSPPPPLAGNFVIDDDITSNRFKMDKMFEGSDESLTLEDNTYPSMGQDMHKLSLNNAGTSSMTRGFDFNSPDPSPEALNASFYGNDPQGFSGREFASQVANASPQMTVQPSKTFFLTGSGDDSPNSVTMMNSHESSPSAMFNSNSPMPTAHNNLSQTFPTNSPLNGLQQYNSSPVSFDAGHAVRNGKSPPGIDQSGFSPWPCQLEVDPTPDKSRVETQIPIRLTLRNAPPGIHKLHLPAHTISKPKFQSKPPFEESDEVLELSAMLVCASAMQKPGLEEAALKRAARDDIYVKSQENQPASSKIHTDDNDPTKPLNGGPVAICSGCIVRERKRAARKKTKKADEEEEWAKDEAKRVIVFNCPEVRDWCVPGTKESPVKDHDGPPLSTMFVHAPMRIACYCRHQSEKIGFKVVFTIRMANGTILAQAISNSIMITDDHKQPSTGQQSTATSNDASPVAAPTTYYQADQGSGFNSGTFHQPMPFRNSFSTNDLRMLGNTYAPQRHPPNFSRENSGLHKTSSTTTSTATATPRNLSRPASPTSSAGPSTKKRRSGGPGHNKVPSGLTMTRMGDAPSFQSGGAMSSNSSTSAGQSPAGFSFTPPIPSGNFGAQMESYQASTATQNHFRSGPPTPLHGPGMPNFGNPLENDIYFYSAPTSQHGSRAPSPTSAGRIGPSFHGNVQIPEQASNALARLPPGFNLHRPPIIQRVIPNLGPQAGGEEVTILGTGFFQGLEVMFGDNFAAATTFWGDTTLVCRSPPGEQPGMVQVIFKHQHQSSDLQQLRGILPTQPVFYEYFDDDRNQMQMLAVDIASQGQSTDVSQMSQEELSQAFLNTSGGFSNYQGGGGISGGQQRQRPSSAHHVAKLTGSEFERFLLNWLDFMDMNDSPYQPRYNKKNRRGGTLLSLAAGSGYHRFCAGLLARGADPNPRDGGGYTPLMMASMRGHVQTVRLLSVRGADPTLRTLSGYTAEEHAATSNVADLLAAMGDRPMTKAEAGAREPPRRPSSTPSLDSLSGMSTSSQTSNISATDDSEGNYPMVNRKAIMLQDPWRTNKEGGDLPSHGEDAQAYSVFQAFAALAAWREQMLAQLQRTVWTFPQLQLPGLPPMPSLPSLPHSINKLDYQQYYEQYSMVRRISDFLSPVSPPAYEDIFPKPLRQDDDAKKVVSPGLAQASIDAVVDGKCTPFLDRPGAGSCEAAGPCTEATKSHSATISKAMRFERLHSIESGALFPWVLLLIALMLGIWNYTAPETCPRSAPLTRFKDMLQSKVLVSG